MWKTARRNTLSMISIAVLILPMLASAQSWNQFLSQIRQEALNQGIRPSILNEALGSLSAPSRKVSSLDKSQPERRITYLQYRNSRADAYRIKIGERKLRSNQSLLNNIEKQTGVSACTITSIWGLESAYGSFKGSFPVIQSLATLSYQGRRTAFFRKQLLYALHMLNDNAVSFKDFKGEWAGASGHCQFLPSSYYKYAVDYTGDGKKDIWNSKPDALASIGNYLKQNGWKNHQPTMTTVTLPQRFNQQLLSLKVTKPVSAWMKMGVQVPSSARINRHLKASIIRPDGGPTIMVFNNFKVLMAWNYSSYYAGTVTYMADKICRRS